MAHLVPPGVGDFFDRFSDENLPGVSVVLDSLVTEGFESGIIADVYTNMVGKVSDPDSLRPTALEIVAALRQHPKLLQEVRRLMNPDTD